MIKNLEPWHGRVDGQVWAVQKTGPNWQSLQEVPVHIDMRCCHKTISCQKNEDDL